MIRDSVIGDRVAANADDAGHDADRNALGLEHATLFDVQLEVGGEVVGGALRAAPLRGIESEGAHVFG